ncbi:unnamed protein product [Notodromas monacha]|uniref:cyclin-dependent kinase n=1 Tax=Notodromas monacha TaxID=399045 RepID=A0A7R9BJY4_9CRUS|nr:unnamed protein product [Notodromas monacha]CAG0916068.1 unnamed protein product [Notodromas monacha]
MYYFTERYGVERFRTMTEPFADLEDGFGYLSLAKSCQAMRIPDKDKTGKCRTVADFEKLDKLGEGTYGVVYKARDRSTNEIVAMKRIKISKPSDGLPVHALREIALLLKYSQHTNIVNVREVVINSKCLHIFFMVMEYCDDDLCNIVGELRRPLPEKQVKFVLQQLLSGLAYLHRHFIVHRDVKLSNLLMSGAGVIKLADFGLARKYCMPAEAELTPGVVTRYYRAPEILFGAKTQTTAVDMWATACVFGELLLNGPILPGKSDAHQVELIIELLGTPSEAIWPGMSNLPAMTNFKLASQPYNNLKSVLPRLSDSGLRLLNLLFMYDPVKRGTAEDALASGYFTENPPPCSPMEMRDYCAKNCVGRPFSAAAAVRNVSADGVAMINTVKSNFR